MLDLEIGPPVAAENFFGREAEVAEIWDKLGRRQNLLLVSPRRVGKSSILHHLMHSPKPGWTVAFVNLEPHSDISDAMGFIVSEIGKTGAAGDRFWKSFKKSIERIEGVKIGLDGVGVTMRDAVGRRWAATIQAFEEALLEALDNQEKLLLIVDEYPILVKKLLEAGKRSEAEDILRLFRQARTHPKLKERFRMIVCGSIGLKPVLRRHKLTADANDLKNYRLGPWSEEIARAFIQKIAEDRPHLNLPDAAREAVLTMTGTTPLPFHVQSMLGGIEDRMAAQKMTAAELTGEQIERVRDDILGDLDFDHYRERMESVFDEAEEICAVSVLRTLPLGEGLSRSDFIEQIEEAGEFDQVIRILIDDGYVSESEGPNGARLFRFANPMLGEFWQRHYAG